MIPRLLVFALTLDAYQLHAGASPIEKVLLFLADMRSVSLQEKADEEVAFVKFKQWCDNTRGAKRKSVEEAEALMEQFSADVAKAKSDADELNEGIMELDRAIDGFKKDMQSATEVRTKEKSEYDETHADYSASIDAVERAISVLSKQDFDRAQASSLLQKVASLRRTPPGAQSVVASLLAADDDIEDPFASQTPGAVGMSVTAPEAHGYQFQSSGVVDMLKKLKDKFDDERTTLDKEELNEKHAYEMVMQSLQDSVERATSAKARKAKSYDQRMEAAAAAQGELDDTTAVRNADKTYLEETIASCKVKSEDYESRQKLRSEERAALDKAIEILSGSSVAGAAAKHLPALPQTSVSFGLLRSKAYSPLQGQAAEYLQMRAERIQSRMLQELASKVLEDPFTKVKKMIKDLIVRLMEEATEETEHKGWCDKELGTNKIARESKAEDVDSLAAQVDKLTAEIAKLTQEVADFTHAIAELDKSVANATAMRSAEKQKNAATLQDAQEASSAISQAMVILKDFYAKAAESTALVQAPLDDAPATFSEPYQGDQGSSNTVLQYLEVIASDFARLESDTTLAEEAAAKEYKTFINESEVDKAMKSAALRNTQTLITKREGDLVETQKDLKNTQEELDAALAYYEKLKPSCVNSGVSYEDRVKRREEEIESLKEALKILSGEDIEG
jgi:chromosome segregation ATPase